MLYKDLKINLNTLFEFGLEQLAIRDKSILEKLITFAHERLKITLLEENLSNDFIEAVISNSAISNIPIYLLRENVLNLKSFVTTNKGNLFLKNYKRIFNILKNVDTKSLPKTINKSLLKTPSEIDLYKYYEKTSSLLDKTGSEKKLDRNVIKTFLSINKIINNFFNKTLVNDKDKKLKRNRLKLLTDVINIFKNFARFEKIKD